MKPLTHQRYLSNRLDIHAILEDQSRGRVRNGGSILIESEGRALAAELEPLDWDSSVLGLNAWRVSQVFADLPMSPDECVSLVQRLQSEIQKKSIRLISLRLPEGCGPLETALTQAGWYEVDRLTLYALELNNVPTGALPKGDMSVEPVGASGADLFLSEQPDLFRFGRMHRDPHFAGGKADRFYRELCARICQNPESTRLGLTVNGRLIGVCLGQIEEAFPDEDLRLAYLWQIAVAQEHQGKGYSRFLLEQFARVMAKRADILEIGTQTDNLAANRLYQSMGLEGISGAVTFHHYAEA